MGNTKSSPEETAKSELSEQNPKMSESEGLIKEEEKSEDGPSEKESNQSEETTNEKPVEDEKDTSTKSPLEALLETEAKGLAKEEEVIENLIYCEKEIEKQSALLPCNSCVFPDPIVERTTTCCLGLCSRSFSRHGGLFEFWIVSAPANGVPQETYDKLKAVTQNKKLSQNYKFHIPNLDIATMDKLISMTDELLKFDIDTEGTIKQLVSFMTLILGEGANVTKHLLVNNMDLATYLTRFTWNVDKYPADKTLDEIFQLLSETIEPISTENKRRSDEIGNLINTLQKLERDTSGSLLTKPLDKLVKKEDFVQGSEYFTTLLVVVNKEDELKWKEEYMTLAEMVVPQSSVRLFRDETHSLYTVVVVKRFAKDFEEAARQSKYTIRKFIFSEKGQMVEDDFMHKLKKVRDVLMDVSFRWLKVKFSECFVAWIHVKALRVFTESVLRFGIPADFQASLLIPLKSKKLKKVLDDLYKNLDGEHSELVDDIPEGLTVFNVKKYSPYVFVTITTNFREH